MKRFTCTALALSITTLCTFTSISTQAQTVDFAAGHASGATNTKTALPSSTLSESTSLSSAVVKNELITTNTNIGFGTGLVAGAALGGPVGAIIGATLGVLMVEEHNDDQHIATLKTDLLAAYDHHQTQAQTIAQLKQMVNEPVIQQVNYTTPSVFDFPEMQSHIQFTTGISEVASAYHGQLALLAQVLTKQPQLQVTLTGFADLRGTDDDNLALSNARVAAVKSMLVKEGVSEDQIKTIALGEARALQTSNWDESLVFDRRVTIDLAPNATMTASN